MLRLFAFCILVSSALPAMAVFKCESGGRIGYSDSPCANGKEIAVDALPSSEASQARERAAAERKRLHRIENERRHSDTDAKREQKRSAKRRAAHEKRCASLTRREKWAREDAANASRKSAHKAQIRARRAAERLKEECPQPQGLQLGA